MPPRPSAVLVIAAAVLTSCRSPTEIRVVVTTDFDCADLEHVTLTVGTLGDALESNPPTSTSSYCSSGQAGSIVVVPSGDDGAVVGIKVVGGFAIKQAEDCAAATGTSPPDYGKGCIVARRALRYVPHAPLTVPIILRSSCDGVPCGVTETCVSGSCVPAMIPDPTECEGAGCGEGTLSSSDAGADEAGPLDAGPAHWVPMASSSTVGFAARSSHSAVWTGTEMIVFGGAVADSFANDGAAYDPLRDAWTMIPTPNLAARAQHVAVWTGTEMVVWGGASGATDWADGARYDPAKNAWTPMGSPGASLGGRQSACASWAPTTGEVVIWSGGSVAGAVYADGAAYRPSADSWRKLSASSLAARSGTGCAWNGSAVVFYGGVCSPGSDCGDGAAYDPSKDAWSPASVAPITPRTPAVSVASTGTSVVFWGGGREAAGYAYGDGVIFDPPSTWTAIPAPQSSIVPVAGRNSAVGWWSGQAFSAWGGASASAQDLGDGLTFDPSTSTWTPLPAGGPSPARESATAVWMGTEAIVWGGANGFTNLDDGRIYVP